MTVLPLCCFPNAAWLRAYQSDNEVVIDIGEHYAKQTYRNRFDILGPNGVLTLSIPVVGQKGEKTSMKDIEIERGKWQQEHLNSIVTAYNSAPFAEHFLHEIEDLFKSPPERLIDFNTKALALSLDWLGLESKHRISEVYVDEFDTDMRSSQKRREGDGFNQYLQVFSDRFDFQGNLSAMDLAMNNGPSGVTLI